MIRPAGQADTAAETFDPAVLPPFRISSDDFFAMIDAGILTDRRVELIDGILVKMSPAGPDHNFSVEALTEAFRPHAAVKLGVGTTIRLLDGQVFDPDFMLLRPGFSYRERFPDARDILLLAECSNSSLPKDLRVKRDVYAKAGIREYWVLDLQAKELLVHRDAADGVYPEPTAFTGDDRIAPAALPEAGLRVGDLFA